MENNPLGIGSIVEHPGFGKGTIVEVTVPDMGLSAPTPEEYEKNTVDARR